jgi:predicted dehydrogenase
MNKVRIGLHGVNGHQIQGLVAANPVVELTALGAMSAEQLPPALRDRGGFRVYATLDEMLADDCVDVVSLCSPRRREQAQDAIKCLKAGKHVYAEKPCAMFEDELDAIMRTATASKRCFREMAGTAFDQPYWEMRRQIAEGRIGAVVQVLAQKSYPYHDARPQDEDVDGGLLMQVGVHAFRFIEHVADTRIRAVDAIETGLGNPGQGGLKMAASYMMTLENGGVAVALANYLNPRAFGSWGNESLRVFGTNGFIEAVDGGARTRLVLNDEDCGSLDLTAPGPSHFDLFIQEILTGTPALPIGLDDELRPTRMVIRAKRKAESMGG